MHELLYRSLVLLPSWSEELGQRRPGTVNTDDRAWCWGQTFFGEVGDGTTAMRLKPVKVLGTLAFAQLGTGQGWTCGTMTAGVGYCWGANSAGTLGDNTQVDRHVPTRIAGPI